MTSRQSAGTWSDEVKHYFIHFPGLECLCGLHVVDNDGSSVRNGVITAPVGNTSTSDCPADAPKVNIRTLRTRSQKTLAMKLF